MKKLLAVLSVLMLVIGVVTLAAGAIVFGLPALIAAVVSVALQFSLQGLCACVVPLLYFICALAVRSGRS